MTVTVTGSRPVELALWQFRGWRLLPEGRLRGSYRAGHRTFEGLINWSQRGFHIKHPPGELRYHSHWPCFHARRNGWYSVHFRVEPHDVDAGILTIEQILYEALGVPNHDVRPTQKETQDVAQTTVLTFEELLLRFLRWLAS